MLRISKNSENGHTVRFRLDGTIDATSYCDLEENCSRVHQTDGTTIILDMAGVIFVNDEAARKLARLRSERLRIINCSPYIETLLKTLEG